MDGEYFGFHHKKTQQSTQSNTQSVQHNQLEPINQKFSPATKKIFLSNLYYFCDFAFLINGGQKIIKTP